MQRPNPMSRFIVFVLAAFLVAAIVGVASAGGRKAPRLPVYNVTKSGLNEREAALLAEVGGFKIQEGGFNSSDGIFDYADGETFQFLPTKPLGDGKPDEDADGNNGQQPPQLEAFDFDEIAKIEPTPRGEALQLAEELFEKVDLKPGNAKPVATHTRFEAVDVKGAEIVKSDIDTQVDYQFSLFKGLPLIGPGAKVVLNFGGDFAPRGITRLLYANRELERGPTAPILTKRKALRQCAVALRGTDGVTQRKTQGRSNASGVRAKLVYYAPPLEFEDVKVIYPHYQCSGTRRVGNETVVLRPLLIPAVTSRSGTPKVRLVKQLRNGRLTVQARVTGGAKPYRYTWDTDTTVLSDRARDTTRRTIRYKLASEKQGRVNVVVTDANGIRVSLSTNERPRSAVAAARAVQVGGVRDSGSEWIGQVQGLAGSKDNAGGFVDRMTQDGVNNRFNWGNANAWEQDFKDPSFAGGDDNDWIDNTDAIFYTGHANGNGFTFEDGNTDSFLHYNDAKWGNKDLEWLTIAACGPLQGSTGGVLWWQRWGPAFDGLHLLMAYENVSYDNTQEGDKFANKMLKNNPKKVRAAWVQTAQAIQPSSVRWAIMGVTSEDGWVNYNDYFHGKGSVGPDVRGSAKAGYWKLSGNS